MSLDSIYQASPPWAQTLFLNAYAAGISRYRRGAAFRAARAELERTQYWEPDRIAAYQSERVAAIVRLAYERTPYYRDLLDERRVKATDVRGTDDLAAIPLLTKETMREVGNRLLTLPNPSPDWRHGHTSGTTGSPLSLWYNRATCVLNEAVDTRQKEWAGMIDSDWIGMFLGRMIVPAAMQKPPFWRVNRVLRQVWFSSFHLGPENLDVYVAELRRRRLRFIEGYPSTIFILAQHLVSTGQVLPMTAVFTSSETLHDVQREAIVAAFGCPPTDFYGHAERVIFGTECEAHDGKHLAETYGFVEVVDDDGNRVPDGESGYLVGTTLLNDAMPLIRYRTGDISAIRREPCACGRTLARIENVSTKAEDIVITPDGRMISPSILTHPFKPFHQIVKSQLIQDRIDHVLVKIVPSDEFTDGHQRALMSELGKRLGPGIVLEVQIVDDIPRERSGKFRWIISQVKHSSHFGWK